MVNRWTMLALVFVARTASGLQFQAVASVAPLMLDELSISYAELGTLIGIYVLPGVIFSVPGSIIGQRLGQRRMVIVSFALMTTGAIVLANAHSFSLAVSGRAVSGLGAIMMNILVTKMVADWFSGREVSTALAVMLSSWPVGLGAAAALLGHVAAMTSWRWAIGVTAAWAAIGLLAMLCYRDAPTVGHERLRGTLAARELKLSISAGLAWGCFNASIVALVAFGPGLLLERGASLGNAGFIVSLAIWITIISVPAGGLVNDWLSRPTHMIVVSSLIAAALTLVLPVFDPMVAFCLVGLAVGGPPGAIMALLPRALRPDTLATGLGVFYTVFYALMAVTQPMAGFARDIAGGPVAPIVFAAAVMAATAAATVLFRHFENA
jgi:predicted MFS family arabinose efflux permease